MKTVLFTLFIFVSTSLFSQSFSVDSLIKNINKTGQLTGTVLDIANDGSIIAFVDVSVTNTNISTSTNIEGAFLLNLQPGIYAIKISFIGYKTIIVKDVEITSNNTTIINQKLSSLEIPFDISSTK
jgi:hypothetical protein